MESCNCVGCVRSSRSRYRGEYRSNDAEIYIEDNFWIGCNWGAVRMLTAKPPEMTGKEPASNPLVWMAWGFPLGIATGIIGIGGGVLMVPVMVVALSFGIHLAVGTSTALMIFTSIGGLVGYIYNGLKAGVPFVSPIGHLIGYVNIESWILLAATSVPMAQIGARVAHKLPAKQLKYVFIIVMLYMGWSMIKSGLGLHTII